MIPSREPCFYAEKVVRQSIRRYNRLKFAITILVFALVILILLTLFGDLEKWSERVLTATTVFDGILVVWISTQIRGARKEYREDLQFYIENCPEADEAGMKKMLKFGEI